MNYIVRKYLKPRGGETVKYLPAHSWILRKIEIKRHRNISTNNENISKKIVMLLILLNIEGPSVIIVLNGINSGS
jgi:hypothetical protein